MSSVLFRFTKRLLAVEVVFVPVLPAFEDILLASLARLCTILSRCHTMRFEVIGLGLVLLATVTAAPFPTPALYEINEASPVPTSRINITLASRGIASGVEPQFPTDIPSCSGPCTSLQDENPSSDRYATDYDLTVLQCVNLAGRALVRVRLQRLSLK